MYSGLNSSYYILIYIISNMIKRQILCHFIYLKDPRGTKAEFSCVYPGCGSVGTDTIGCSLLVSSEGALCSYGIDIELLEQSV
jgi:hypothetical protein